MLEITTSPGETVDFSRYKYLKEQIATIQLVSLNSLQELTNLPKKHLLTKLLLHSSHVPVYVAKREWKNSRGEGIVEDLYVPENIAVEIFNLNL